MKSELCQSTADIMMDFS